MLKKIVFLVMLSMSLLGNDFDIFATAFHGHFCGKDTPKLNYSSPQDEIEKLSKIAPVDTIDAACKEHDICYLQRGSGSKSCDNELVLSMKRTYKKYHDKNCRVLSKAILLFFDTKNYNPITLMTDNYSTNDKIKDLPAVSAKNMFNMGSFMTDLAINYGYSKPTGYIFDSGKNSERNNEVLYVFPPRYKVCTY